MFYFSSRKYNYSLLVMTGTVKFDEIKINITDIVLVRSLMVKTNDVEFLYSVKKKINIMILI